MKEHAIKLKVLRKMNSERNPVKIAILDD